MNFAWVTSWNQRLWELSGKTLCDSFARFHCEGDLIVYGEGDDATHLAVSKRYDLVDDDYLVSWLRANRDVIPTELGGDATKASIGCRCPNGHNRRPSTKHYRGCRWDWWSRNASRWFRKVAAMRHAKTLGYDVLVWLDCDCYFTRTATADWVAGVMQRSDVTYLKGYRKVPECGLVAYDLRRDGLLMLDEVERLYEGDFRRLDRWDDSFVFWHAVQYVPVNALDVGPRGGVKDGHVVKGSPWGQRIVHNKGYHAKQPYTVV